MIRINTETGLIYANDANGQLVQLPSPKSIQGYNPVVKPQRQYKELCFGCKDRICVDGTIADAIPHWGAGDCFC